MVLYIFKSITAVKKLHTESHLKIVHAGHSSHKKNDIITMCMHMGTQITTHNTVQSRITRGHTKYSHTETEYVENCAAHATYIVT